MNYNKNVLDLINLVLDNPTFRDGKWKYLSIDIQTEKNYATIELSYSNANTELEHNLLLNKAIDYLKDNKDLAHFDWFKKIAIAISSLNVRHNRCSWEDSLTQLGIDLPLSNDLLKYFLISRETNNIPFIYRHVSNNFNQQKDVMYDSVEFKVVPDILKGYKKFDNLRNILTVVFDYNSLKDDIKNNLLASDNSLWFSKLLCGLLFQLDYSRSITVGYMSNLANLWTMVVNSKEADFKKLLDVSCVDRIFEIFFNSNEFIVLNLDLFYETIMKDICLFDEDVNLMFVDNHSHEKLLNEGKLFIDFLMASKVLKREYLKRKLHQGKSECSCEDDVFKI